MVTPVTARAAAPPSRTTDDPQGAEFSALLSRKNTPVEQQDVQAWQEIERRRGLGRSDQEIWFDAVQNGEIEIAGAFVRQPPDGFDINMTDSVGQNALHKAVTILGHYLGDPGGRSPEEARAFGKERTLDMLRLLIEDGRIDKARLDDSGTSAWDVAAQYDSVEEMQDVADYLKEQLNAEAEAAVENSDQGRLDELIAAGADPREIEQPEDPTPQPEVGPLTGDTQIPEDDTRTAEEIAADSEVYSQLSEVDREALLDKIGEDVTDERRKVYLAVAVLNHIQNFDEDGNVIIPTGEGVIDGWTRADRTDPKSEAVHGTEAGRFQDFIKYGWSNLKGDSNPDGTPPRFEDPPENLTPPEDPEAREAQEIVGNFPLLANLSQNDKDSLKERVGDFDTDPVAALRAVEVLNHIERYDEEGLPIRGGETIGNGIIDGWTRADRNDPRSEAVHGTEAGRFQDFIKYGWSSLKTETDTTKVVDIAKLEELAADVGDDYGKFEAFITTLKENAYYAIIGEAGLPADKRDIIADPDSYSTEERGAAILELSIMMERITGGLEHYSERGALHGSIYFGDGDYELNTDPAKVISGIQQAIDKLTNEEVGAWISERETEALQEITAGSPELRDFVRSKMDAIRGDAWGLDAAIDQDGDLVDNMSSHLGLATTLNLAAGENGAPYIENLVVDIRESGKFEEITQGYEDQLGDPFTLKEMIAGGMTPDEAIAELNARAAVFASYGSPPGDLSASINANIQQYYLDTTNGDELVGIILNEDGSLDEGRLEAVIEEIRRTDPDSAFLRDDNGAPLSNAQIIGGVRNGWDSLRSQGKWNHSLSKFGPGFMSENNPIRQVYGYGGMHFVSGLLAVSAMIAKGASDEKTDELIISAIGSGLQTLGLAGETFALQSRTDGNQKRIEALRNRWNNSSFAVDPKRNPSPEIIDGRRNWAVSAETIKNSISRLTDLSRLVNATGGSLILGASIAAGIEEIKKGNPAGAAVYFSAGIANFSTAPTAYMQSILPSVLKNFSKMTSEQIARLVGRIALWGGRIGSVTNPIAFLAMLGYELFRGIKEDIDMHNYFEGFTPTLYEYGINGGEDPWYDEDHDKHGALHGS